MRSPTVPLLAILAGATIAGGCREREPLTIAITVDDLPAAEPLSGTGPGQVLQTLIAAFKQHHLPPVYGFVNGARLEGAPDGKAALAAWVAAGNRLGNHTYSHVDLADVGLEAYLADVERDEPVLRELGGPPAEWHMFRYPFLREGTDGPSRDRLHAELTRRGYRIAPVTIDFEDWAWNPAWARCRDKHDDAALAELRASFIASALSTLDWADHAAREVWGRRIKHVLLMHAGAFDAQMIGELLTQYEKRGVRFVSLDEALGDPVYRDPPRAPRSMRGNLLYQAVESRPQPIPPPSLPGRQLGRMCR